VTVMCTCKDSSLLFVFVMCQELWSVEQLQSVSECVERIQFVLVNCGLVQFEKE